MTPQELPLFNTQNIDEIIIATVVAEGHNEAVKRSTAPLYFMWDDTPETGRIGNKFMHRYVKLSPSVESLIAERMSRGEIGSLKAIYWKHEDVTTWRAKDTSMIASVLIAKTPGVHPWATNKPKGG